MTLLLLLMLVTNDTNDGGRWMGLTYATGCACGTSSTSKGEGTGKALAKETPIKEAPKKRLAKRIMAIICIMKCGLERESVELKE